MTDIDDVTAAADHIEQKLPHTEHTPRTARTYTPVLERLDHATREQLAALMRGGIGEPEQ